MDSNNTSNQPGESQVTQTQAPSGNQPPPSTPEQPMTPTKINPFQSSNQGEPEWVKTMRQQQGKPPLPEPKTQTQAPVQQTQATQQPAQTQVQTPEVPVAPVAPQMTPETIATAVRAGMEPMVAAMRPPPQVQMPTDADVMKQMNVFNAGPQDFEQMFGFAPERPEQLAALNNALQGVARQAVTIAQFLNKQAVDQVRSEMMPYVNAVRAEQATKYETEFYKGNEDLTPYKPLVMQVFKGALAEGRRFPSPNDAAKFVADTTRQLLKDSGIPLGVATGGRGAGTTGQTTPGSSQRSRTMTPTSMGGRGGGSSSATPTKNTAEAVFGPH